MDNLLGPAHLLAPTSLHLKFIGELLTVAAGEGRAELLAVGARYAEFAGWLHQDAGDPQAAAYWSARAMGWAQAAAGNDLMVSYVLMRKSNQASSLGDANRTLRLARAALRGQDRLSPRARALALRQEARGFALSGDPTGCARALDAARNEAAAPEDQGEEDRVLTGYCTPAFIEMEAADCAMLLGQPDQAVVTFQHGLAICQGSISGIERSTWPDSRSPMQQAESRSWPAPSPKRPPLLLLARGRRGPLPSCGGCRRCCRDGQTRQRLRS